MTSPRREACLNKTQTRRASKSRLINVTTLTSRKLFIKKTEGIKVSNERGGDDARHKAAKAQYQGVNTGGKKSHRKTGRDGNQLLSNRHGQRCPLLC